MAIAFVGYGTNGYPGYGSSPGLPTYSENDILILVGVSPDATAMTIDANGTGWTEIFQHQYSTEIRLAAWWKRAGASELAPRINDGNRDNGAVAWITSWSGVPAGLADPIGVLGAFTDIAATDGTQEIAGLTPPVDGAMVIALYGAKGGSGLNTTSVESPLTNSIKSNFATSNGFGASSSGGYFVQTTAGDTGDLVINTNEQAYPTTTVAFALVDSSGGTPLPLSGSGSSEWTGSATLSVRGRLVADVSWGWTSSATLRIVADTVALVGVGAWAFATIAYLGVRAHPFTRLQIVHAASITGDSTPGLLVDGRYKGTFDWPHSAADYAAIDLGTDAARTQVRVNLSAEDTVSGYDAGRAVWQFRILTSSDSTNGVDGTWTTYDYRTPDGFEALQHFSEVFPFTGCRWLKLIADSIPAIDEFEIWDATGETSLDSVLFIGDSITVRATKRGNQSGVGQQPSFQTLFQTYRGIYIEQNALAKVGEGASWINAILPDALAAYPHPKYWLISIGTNDANGGSATIADFATDLITIATDVLATGHVPMFARIPYTSNDGYGGGGPFGADDTALYNSVIDYVAGEFGLPPGPDLYTYAYNNLASFYDAADGGDSVHPGRQGCRDWNRLWFEAVSSAMSVDAGDVSFVSQAGLGATFSGAARVRHGISGSIGLASSGAATLSVHGVLRASVSWGWSGAASMIVSGAYPLYADEVWAWSGEAMLTNIVPVHLVSEGVVVWDGVAILSSVAETCTVTTTRPIIGIDGAPLEGVVIEVWADVPQLSRGFLLGSPVLRVESGVDGHVSFDLSRDAAAVITCRHLGIVRKSITVPDATDATLDELLGVEA